MKRPLCQHCGRNRGQKKWRVGLVRQVAANGGVQIGWWCRGCERWAQNGWFSHDEVARYLGRWNKTIDDIPILRDYRDDVRCEICGSRGGESHHFAPQSMRDFFGDDWPKWPEINLCRYHHALWHQIVTWYMPGYKDAELAQELRDRWTKNQR